MRVGAQFVGETGVVRLAVIGHVPLLGCDDGGLWVILRPPPPNLPHFCEIGEEFRVVSSPKVARLWGRPGGGGILNRDDHSIQILHDLIIPKAQDAIAVSG